MEDAIFSKSLSLLWDFFNHHIIVVFFEASFLKDQGSRQHLNQPLQNIAQNFHDDVIIMRLTSLLWHLGKTWKILSIVLSRQTSYIQVGYVEYCGLLHYYHFTWVISKKFWSKYILKLNSASSTPTAPAAIKQLLSGAW